MKRQIVYPGSIPLDSDLLNTNRNTMVAIAKVAAAMLGTATIVNGLACTPTSPASMQVQVAPGEIYSLANLDGTAYGSLAADTTHQILKQGILLDAATLSCPAPTTNGFSVNYLIEATYQDVDSNALVLPYYNASNPSQAFSGAGNNGAAQNTTRDGVCSLQVKAGIAATTGAQVTPSADSGYVGLWVVTVAYGQTTIALSNITQATNAPFLTENLTQKISQSTADQRYATQTGFQQNTYSTANAGGTADAITATYSPAISGLTNGMTLNVRASSANVTTTPTFTPAGSIPAKTIVKGNGLPLSAGDIAGGGHWIELQYDLTLDKWVILNPATGISGGDQVARNAAAIAAPAGEIKMWPTATAPNGYLMCAGAAVSRTTYAALFAVIGVTFGAGDGSTTFNLPNYADRMPIGAGTIASLAATGGSKDAVVVSHTHTASVSDPGHVHYMGRVIGSSGGLQFNGAPGVADTYPNTASATTGISVSNAATGVSGTNANLPPYLGINFIIKT